MIRTSYVKQVAISVAKKVKYKSLTRYVLLSVCISTVVNLLTISPLRNSDSFVTEGLRLFILLVIEMMWITLVSVLATLVEWRIWFEAYFLLCYVPCLIYYFFHCRFLWHNDFMMACDMDFRWGHFNK